MDCPEIKEEICDIDRNTVHEIISTLETIVGELKDIDPDIIKQAVDEFLSEEDIEEMISIYHKCFDKYPNNNDIKIYVLHLFNTLQIPIYRDVDNNKL